MRLTARPVVRLNCVIIKWGTGLQESPFPWHLGRLCACVAGRLFFYEFAWVNSQCIGNLDYIGGFCALKRTLTGHVFVECALIYTGFIGQALNRPAFCL